MRVGGHPVTSPADTIREALDGIDHDETEHPNGWWETSSGAKFGAARKAIVLAALAELEQQLAAVTLALEVCEIRDMTATAEQWEMAFKNERIRAEAAKADRDRHFQAGAEAMRERLLAEADRDRWKKRADYAEEVVRTGGLLREQIEADRDRLQRLVVEHHSINAMADMEWGGRCPVCSARPDLSAALATPDTPPTGINQTDERFVAEGWFIPEGDRTCGVIHRYARATCMKRAGHDGPHATAQGHWIDGPWCEYPETERAVKAEQEVFVLRAILERLRSLRGTA
jgi:hypothetical protein